MGKKSDEKTKPQAESASKSAEPPATQTDGDAGASERVQAGVESRPSGLGKAFAAVADADDGVHTPKGFADEIPATSLPERVIPEDESAEQVRKFCSLLDGVHGLIPEPELASNAIRGIMVELKHNRQYIKHVQPDDVRIIVRLMRETMGIAKVAKAATKAKRTAKVDADMMDDLASLGLGADE
jgi:hypothetical protein